MVHHSCPKCGCGKKAHASTVKHKCKMCGGAWYDDLANFGNKAVSAVKSVASNPLAQAAFNMAAPAAMNLANQYAPGAVSAVNRGMNLANMAQQAYSNPMATAMNLANQYAPGAVSSAQRAMSSPYAQAAMSNPMVQAAFSSGKKRVGLGYRNPYAQPVTPNTPNYTAKLLAARKMQQSGGVQLRDATAGEVSRAQMRASGRKRRGGKKGGPGASPMDLAGKVLGAIPGAAEALGPFGALLGIEAPPPPPPHATFSAVRQGPMVAARPRTLGRGRRGKRGGFNLGSVVDFGKKAFSTVKNVASNPMVQQLASMAAPAAMNLANQYAPGAMNAVNRGMQVANMAQQAYSNPMATAMSLAHQYAPGAVSSAQRAMSNPYAQAAMSNPMVQAAFSSAKKRVGLGRRTRPPTAHSQAVGKVMRESGMSLPEASRYVKQNGLAY